MRPTRTCLVSLLLGGLLLPSNSLAAPASESCLECHAAGIDGKLRVDPKALARGPHKDVGCVECHVQAARVADVTEHGRLGRASCGGCHEAARQVAQGAHGRARRGGQRPSCTTCHGAHDLRRVADSGSRAHRSRQVQTCGACHGGLALAHFRQSVHGARLEGGMANAPTCTTCHGAHAIPEADIVRSSGFKLDMTRRCGACHGKVRAQYQASVHGVALSRGVSAAASCVDCHRGHEILPPADRRSAVHPTRVMNDCASCHADARLIRRLCLPPEVVKSYALGYHGRASQRGDATVASCPSCHEAHAIYAATDRRSSVHPDNLHRSCGRCHPGATANFIRGKVHVVPERASYGAWLARTIYIWIIILGVGIMVLHNLLDFVRKLIVRSQRRVDLPQIVRMTVHERAAHLCMMLCFITLTYTGFAVLYPGAWWTAPLGWLSSTDDLRRWLHRGAGLVLTGLVFHHLYFIFGTRRGREQRREFWPRLRDFRHLWLNLLFYFGRRETRPQFTRFTYMEKAEYWALVWGTGLMVVTGFVVWFDEQAMRLIPRSAWEVFLIVHRYEAILALLTIMVWHFYYIFANPDESPMALTWLTGRISLEAVERIHPEEFARIDLLMNEHPEDLARLHAGAERSKAASRDE